MVNLAVLALGRGPFFPAVGLVEEATGSGTDSPRLQAELAATAIHEQLPTVAELFRAVSRGEQAGLQETVRPVLPDLGKTTWWDRAYIDWFFPQAAITIQKMNSECRTSTKNCRAQFSASKGSLQLREGRSFVPRLALLLAIASKAKSATDVNYERQLFQMLLGTDVQRILSTDPDLPLGL